ncbi:uncharacterized protein BDCG_08401 [Blastomyces dermatitidis ER-3]|uniref:Uncharacterized protein n=1 Tax=Ajellomyces dermatitidis (strain ER-3 / ATCC MYA-2586) TaxID=559297 RepID=A0ABP2ENV4_AJEDR|nr:uncharacterized protein BDCG_08401 [Blastomyces dermatitidis ER-3]EEQ85132.2 hypothetical protein BDCG_08401 [Blastomyces dermatitidis ER-3]
MQETGSPHHMQTLGLRKHLFKLAMDDKLLQMSHSTSPGKIDVHNFKGRKRRHLNARILKSSTAALDIQIASILQPSSPSNDSEDHLSEEPNGPGSLMELNISTEEAAVQPATLSSTTSGEDSTLPCTLQPSDEGGSFTLSGTMQLKAPADLQAQSVDDVD